MPKKMFYILFLLLVLSGFVYASPFSNARGGELVSISAPVYDNLYAAGETVNIINNIYGDAIAAGGTVLVSSRVEGDIIVAGGEVKVSPELSEDVRVAGGNVFVSGYIQKDLIAFGGEIDVDRDAKIGSNAVVSGGTVKFDGTVSRDLIINGGEVFFDGSVYGDLTINSPEIFFGENSFVNGNLQVPEGVSVENVVVNGNVTYSESDYEYKASAAKDVAGLLFGKTMWFVSILVLALLVMFVVKDFYKTSSKLIYADPWKILLYGVLTVLAIPFGIAVLFLTILGIPIALLALVIFLILICYSTIVSSYLVGEFVFKLLKLEKVHIVWSLIVGIILLAVLKEIPFLGGLIGTSAVLFGMGTISYRVLGKYKVKTKTDGVKSKLVSSKKPKAKKKAVKKKK